MSAPSEYIEARDRSYRVRLRGNERVERESGERGTVIGPDSNAGFRGIEALVAWDSGERSNVSTGRLRVIA